MEKAVYPLKYMNITQGVNGSYSHMGTNAIDIGNRGYKEDLYAPFNGIIKKVYKASGNFVWLQSKDKVKWADGTIDYMTVMTGHDDNVESLYVGKEIKAGEVYYTQGNAGNSTGIHVHIEVGKGKYTGSGWYQNSQGRWMINNSVRPETAFFVKPDTVIVNDAGYNWINIIKNPTIKNDLVDQIEIKVNNLRCRKTPNGEILGFIEKGFYDIIGNEKNGDYTWYKIAESNWVAYDKSWSNLHIVKNKEDIVKDIETSDNKVNNDNFIDAELTKIFTCKKEDTYYIKLNKGDTLYIKCE